MTLLKNSFLVLEYLLFLFFVVLFTSCSNQRHALYFPGAKDTTFMPRLDEAKVFIQKNDVLSINVSSLNPQASAVFNVPNTATINTTSAKGSGSQQSGYLVDDEGNIQFPVLGSIAAVGLTKKQLSDKIAKLLVSQKQLLDPIVSVRFLNFRITVLGDVGTPTVVSVANEKISILEALGMAGDLSITARRNNVLLVREEDGITKLKRLDLTSSSIFTSPYYYLKSNDIIYVEPNKSKVANTNRFNQLLPVIISSLSLVVIILDHLIR